ncbi:MAG: (2Fe-2S)-binding protein [Chloroflexi bacterium]|nr:(2Fe-2S)-binding protein [Chloroflexota bacterium]
MAEYIVAQEGEIPDGDRRLVQVHGREIGVFNLGGKYYALPNICIHQAGPLCTGRISGTLISNTDTNWKLQWGFEGEIVTCPWHALEFNITTGQCLAFPKRRLRSYTVKVEQGQIKLVL